MLFEDAFVVRDRAAVTELFEDGAVLVVHGAAGQARGCDEIARVALALWEEDVTYVADPARVLQARGTALVITRRGVNVARRAGDGTWRYAIALLALQTPDRQEQT